MSENWAILHTEHGDDGSVTYTGIIPGAIALTLMLVALILCAATIIATFALAVRVVGWAFA